MLRMTDSGSHHLLRCCLTVLLVTLGLTTAPSFAAERITYYHTDALGSPVAATDQQGNVVWRESYEPYGQRIKKEPASSTNARWHTSHVLDAETGLQYAGARYYDPVIGRFMGVDPKGFSQRNPHSFNRYAYGNNNPYAYIDPDGQAAVLALIPPVIIGGIIYYAATPDQRAQMGSVVTQMGQNFQSNMQLLGDKIGSLTRPIFSESSSNNEGAGNTNPYNGPVSRPVIVVDPQGNAFPVDKGQKLGASPDGKWVEVKDSKGNPTGTRLDNGHSSHTDPRAQEPHAHRPGIANPDRTPWLPVQR